LPGISSSLISSQGGSLADLLVPAIDDPASRLDVLLEGIPACDDGGGVAQKDSVDLLLQKGGQLFLSLRHVEEEEGET